MVIRISQWGVILWSCGKHSCKQGWVKSRTFKAHPKYIIQRLYIQVWVPSSALMNWASITDDVICIGVMWWYYADQICSRTGTHLLWLQLNAIRIIDREQELKGVCQCMYDNQNAIAVESCLSEALKTCYSLPKSFHCISRDSKRRLTSKYIYIFDS